MRRLINSKCFVPLFLFLIILLSYFKLPNGFFEQDEWHSFGHYTYLLSLPLGKFLRGVLASGPFTHFTPLSLLTKMTMFKIIGLNASYFFIVSILLHYLVSISIYFLINKFLKNKPAALLGSLFFALNATHHQAVSWLGTFEGVELSALFGILALNKCLDKKVNFWLVGFFLLASLLFKEIGFIFLVLVLNILVFFKKYKTVQGRRGISKIIIFFAFYIFLKFSYLFLGVSAKPAVIAGSLISIKSFIFYNVLTLLPKFVSLSLLPLNLFEYLSKITLRFFSDFLPEVNAIWLTPVDWVFDILSVGTGFILIITFFFLLKKKRSEYLISLLFIFLSAALILPLKKFVSYPDSRYFYTATIGISFIISLFWLKVEKADKAFLRNLFIFFYLVVVGLNIYFLETTIGAKVEEGQLRRKILSQIQTYLPILPQNTVIFTESDKSFYGLNQDIFPFQSGLGQIILLTYSMSRPIPSGFFTNELFWDIKSEGYVSMDGQGFGFYYDFDKLEKTVNEKEIPPESVFGFSYSSSEGKVFDISRRIRTEIAGRNLSQKAQVLNFGATSSYNQKDLFLMTDGDRKTYWSPGVPYSFPQDLEIDLGKPKKVAQIQIDSYTNKDQNEVGYILYVSNDGNTWTEAFKDNKRIPDKNGIVNMYLQTTRVRYMKVQQIGSHDFAEWVVHELKIYGMAD